MILEGTLKLEAVLAAAVSANQPESHVDYFIWNVDDVTAKPASFRTALNSNTDVSILAAPTVNGVIREVQRVSIYNKDTAAVTLTVKTDDGTTERILHKVVLSAASTLCFDKGRGWYVLNPDGLILSGTETSGGLVLLDTQVASNSATLNFTSGIDGTYPVYLFAITNIVPQTDTSDFWALVSEDGGANWQTDATDYAWNHSTVTGTSHAGTGDVSDAQIVLSANLGNGSGESLSGTLYLFRPAGATNKLFKGQFSQYNATPAIVSSDRMGAYLSMNAINAIQFKMSSGNITSGNARLYGLKST